MCTKSKRTGRQDKNDRRLVMGVVLIVLLVLGLIFIGPVFTIMALNTLFGLSIAINLGTWLAAAWLTMLIAAKVSK